MNFLTGQADRLAVFRGSILVITPVHDCLHRTIFPAASAMETMFLLDDERLTFRNTALRAILCTGSASDTGICYGISLWGNFTAADYIALSENRIYAQIEIFNSRITDFKYNPDITCVSGIDVGKIRLFGENGVNPIFLFILRGWCSLCRKADHFFIPCIAKNLNTPISKQLFAKILSPCRKKIQCVRLVMNGADIAYLRISILINGCKGKNANILQLFQTGLYVHISLLM